VASTTISLISLPWGTQKKKLSFHEYSTSKKQKGETQKFQRKYSRENKQNKNKKKANSNIQTSTDWMKSIGEAGLCLSDRQPRDDQSVRSYF